MKHETSDWTGTWAAETDAQTLTLATVAAAVAEIERIAGPMPTRAQPYTYRAKNVSVFIDGTEMKFEGAISWNYQPTPPTFTPRFLRGPETYEGTISVMLPMRRRVWRQFVRSMRRPRRLYASFETLIRRASYGGRKGRRALRQLMSMSDAAWKDALA